MTVYLSGSISFVCYSRRDIDHCFSYSLKDIASDEREKTIQRIYRVFEQRDTSVATESKELRHEDRIVFSYSTGLYYVCENGCQKGHVHRCERRQIGTLEGKVLPDF